MLVSIDRYATRNEVLLTRTAFLAHFALFETALTQDIQAIAAERARILSGKCELTLFREYASTFSETLADKFSVYAYEILRGEENCSVDYANLQTAAVWNTDLVASMDNEISALNGLLERIRKIEEETLASLKTLHNDRNHVAYLCNEALIQREIHGDYLGSGVREHYAEIMWNLAVFSNKYTPTTLTCRTRFLDMGIHSRGSLFIK